MAATITGEAGLQTTSSITCNLMALLGFSSGSTSLSKASMAK